MTDKLKLYNEALLMCGERFLSSLTENREPRHLLDYVYDNDGIKACLESGQWKFATRAVMLDYDPSYDREFGYLRMFQKPTDWCSTSAMCSDEYFSSTILNYSDENGFWYTDLDKIYVKYISDDNTFGMDLSIWPLKFTLYVAAYFASRIISKITSDLDRQNFIINPQNGLLAMSFREAKNHDAFGDPPKFLPIGSWAGARGGRSAERRGNKNNLIG